jgi:hypothetical protein
MYEGLRDHPDVTELVTDNDIITDGRVRHRGCKNELDLASHIMDSDLVFVPHLHSKHYRNKKAVEALSIFGAWNKTVTYDFYDKPDIHPDQLKHSKAYFKRSICRENGVLPGTIPLNFGILDSYELCIRKVDYTQRFIDVGFLFDVKFLEAMKDNRRGKVYRHLKDHDWKRRDVMIGEATAGDREGRMGVLEKWPNGWTDYMNLMRHMKIIFTAYPDGHDGDSRTWEAMTSGALVFMDKTHIPTPNMFEDKKHCIYYDATDDKSIKNAILQAEYYLKHDKERCQIAENGREHAMKYHRSKNRLEYVLDSID